MVAPQNRSSYPLSMSDDLEDEPTREAIEWRKLQRYINAPTENARRFMDAMLAADRDQSWIDEVSSLLKSPDPRLRRAGAKSMAYRYKKWAEANRAD